MLHDLGALKAREIAEDMFRVEAADSSCFRKLSRGRPRKRDRTLPRRASGRPWERNRPAPARLGRHGRPELVACLSPVAGCGISSAGAWSSRSRTGCPGCPLHSRGSSWRGREA